MRVWTKQRPVDGKWWLAVHPERRGSIWPGKTWPMKAEFRGELLCINGVAFVRNKELDETLADAQWMPLVPEDPFTASEVQHPPHDLLESCACESDLAPTIMQGLADDVAKVHEGPSVIDLGDFLAGQVLCLRSKINGLRSAKETAEKEVAAAGALVRVTQQGISDLMQGKLRFEGKADLEEALRSAVVQRDEFRMRLEASQELLAKVVHERNELRAGTNKKPSGGGGDDEVKCPPGEELRSVLPSNILRTVHRNWIDSQGDRLELRAGTKLFARWSDPEQQFASDKQNGGWFTPGASWSALIRPYGATWAEAEVLAAHLLGSQDCKAGIRRRSFNAICRAVLGQTATGRPDLEAAYNGSYDDAVGAVASIDSKPRCHANRDGECNWAGCPQNRDGEPAKSGRSCPLWVTEEDES